MNKCSVSGCSRRASGVAVMRHIQRLVCAECAPKLRQKNIFVVERAILMGGGNHEARRSHDTVG